MALALDLSGHGLTVSEIAARLQIPRSTVSDWCARNVLPHSYAGPSAVGEYAAKELCPNCLHETHEFEALGPPYSHLLGLYLGDGSISSHPRGVFRLRVFLDVKYAAIIEGCATSIHAVMPENSVHRQVRPDNCVVISSYSRSWPCLFPQHGPGKKHERSIVLSDWQRAVVETHPHQILRGFIESDGCRFINSGRNGWSCPRYAFYNLSADIHGIFRWVCDLLELHWTDCPRTTYVSRRADVERLDEFIGPKR